MNISEAITIHKSQGSSLLKVTVQLLQKMVANYRSLIYVAFSRATSLCGLYLIGTFVPPLPPASTNKVVVEMNRLKTEAPLIPKYTGLKTVPEEDVQIISHNVRSLKAHINSIRNDKVFLSSNFILAQETWLGNSDSNETIKIPNKSVIARNQYQNGRAKGTIIFGPDMSDFEPVVCFDRNQSIKIDLTMCTFNDVHIFNVYKSKDASIDKLKDLLEEYETYVKGSNVLLCGDFNASLSLTSPIVTMLRDKFHLDLLSPVVSTTIYNTTIDGIFGHLTNYHHEIRMYESYFSDHKPLVVRLRRKEDQSTGLTQELNNSM